MATAAPLKRRVKKADIINDRPYLENGEWRLQERLYPPSRGYEVHRFEDAAAAWRFIEDAE